MIKIIVYYNGIFELLYGKHSDNDEMFLDKIYKKESKKLESVDIDIISYIW